MNKWIIVCVAWILAGNVKTFAEEQDTLKYRISLKDKHVTAFSLDHPEQFLSSKAIERRRRQGIEIDSTDLPVCSSYIESICRKGLQVVTKGKWENFVTVACNDTSWMAQVSALPFVKSIERVWMATKQMDVTVYKEHLRNKPKVDKDAWYGPAYTQIAMCQGHKLHEAGFRGEGMTVAVIDAGFQNLDSIHVLDNLRILGMRDFVHPHSNLFRESAHGLSVLSCIGANRPGVMVGTAPEASFWLFRSEDEQSEHLVEQDYWCEAVEFADSVGVDVLNTSLGYYSFDDASKNYQLRHLDGHYALMSRQASRVADKGMVLVCSAGNSGSGSWKKITPPADADWVLTVGAVNKEGLLAGFSSVGHTADGRIKPDVVAVGWNADVIRPDGNQGVANGTSFAAPVVCGLVTCLWQACPQLTAKQLIELVRRSGDRMEYPDNIYGYGVPDVWKAYQWTLDK